jgi:nuclease-like protein
VSNQHGKAGQGAREMAFKRELIVLGCAVGIFLLGWIWLKNAASISALGLPAVIVLVVAFRLLVGSIDKKAKHVHKRAKQAERGAKAEVKVAEQIESLPDGFTAFHDLSFPGFNIDHVAVGQAGIFLIETKSHGGKITVDGDQLLLNGKPTEKNFISQSWRQCYQLRDFLKEKTGKTFKVNPVLCFSNAFVEIRNQVKGVTVLNMKYLNTFFGKQETQLSIDDIQAISNAIKSQVE